MLSISVTGDEQTGLYNWMFHVSINFWLAVKFYWSNDVCFLLECCLNFWLTPCLKSVTSRFQYLHELRYPLGIHNNFFVYVENQCEKCLWVTLDWLHVRIVQEERSDRLSGLIFLLEKDWLSCTFKRNKFLLQ